MRSSVVLFCLVLIGCTGGPSPEPALASSLASQLRVWEDAEIESYRYAFQQQCFCVREQVQPVTIEVRDGRIERVISDESGQDLSGDPNLRWYTIPELFTLIEEAEANDQEPLVVRYDPELGYPTHIEIGSLAADAGVIYSASELRPF